MHSYSHSQYCFYLNPISYYLFSKGNFYFHLLTFLNTDYYLLVMFLTFTHLSADLVMFFIASSYFEATQF